MDEITTIELLCKILMGEKKEKLPPNSIQLRNAQQKQMPLQRSVAKHVAPAQPVTSHQATASTPGTDANYVSDDDNDALPDLDTNYISESDDEEDNIVDTTIRHRARRNNRIVQQMQ